MRYGFKDIFNEDIYNKARVVFILGKYTWFNNMVCDTFKGVAGDRTETIETTINVSDEFGIEDDEEETGVSSVDFNTFFDVVGVKSINGKWYCRTGYSLLNKKQNEKLMKYIKEPSENGILLITSEDWNEYKDLLKLKIPNAHQYVHIFSLSFPNRDTVSKLVTQSFKDMGIRITPQALSNFMIRMNKAYDKYEETISMICETHKDGVLDIKEMRQYMKGIAYYDVEDFLEELLKPMSSDKTNSKKVLKIMAALLDDITPLDLVYKLLREIDKYLEYRYYINKGVIPIGVKYFFDKVIKEMPEKYKEMNEWKFRREVYIASLTSLRDWEYMKLILLRAVSNIEIGNDRLRDKCKKALYEVCTRSVLTESRINNIIGLDNVLKSKLESINNIKYMEDTEDENGKTVFDSSTNS